MSTILSLPHQQGFHGYWMIRLARKKAARINTLAYFAEVSVRNEKVL